MADYAIAANGVDQYLLLSDARVDLESGETLLWIGTLEAKAGEDFHYVLSTGPFDNNNINYLYDQSTNRFRARRFNDVTSVNTYPNVLTGTPHLLAVQKDFGNEIYAIICEEGGAAEYLEIATNTTQSSPTPWYVMRRGDTSIDRYAKGQTHKMAFFSSGTDLSQADIEAIAAGADPTTFGGILLNWPMNEGTGLTTTDTQEAVNISLEGYNPPNDDSQWILLSGGGFTLTPNPGTFTYSGGAVNLNASRTLIPETANFSYSGGAVSLLRGFNLVPEAGVFSYSGGAVNLTAARVLTLEVGAFSYSGGNVDILAHRQLTPETGSFSYSGGAVEITYNTATGFTLTPDPGTFSYSGGAVQITASRSLVPESGVFSYAGGALQITADRVLTPETGEFDYLGGEIGLIAARNLTPESGVYTYSGGAVTISYSGQVIRRVSTYSVNYEQDYIVGAYLSDSITGEYAADDVTGSYQGIQ